MNLWVFLNHPFELEDNGRGEGLRDDLRGLCAQFDSVVNRSIFEANKNTVGLRINDLSRFRDTAHKLTSLLTGGRPPAAKIEYNMWVQVRHYVGTVIDAPRLWTRWRTDRKGLLESGLNLYSFLNHHNPYILLRWCEILKDLNCQYITSSKCRLMEVPAEVMHSHLWIHIKHLSKAASTDFI